MKKKIVSGVILTLLLTSMLVLTFNVETLRSEPRTIIVPDDYEKIQWAIGNATDGDTIFVRAGTYYEHVIVDKSLSVVGENQDSTIIDGSGTGNVVTITAHNVNISRFTIKNSGVSVQECGIYLLSSSCNISNNIITNNNHGIRGYSSSDNMISGNNITANCYHGIVFGEHSNRNNISGNTMYGNGQTGVKISTYSEYNILAKNIIDFHNYTHPCIQIDGYCNYNIIYNNTLTNSWSGIQIWRSYYNNVSRNIIMNNDYYGIWFDHGSNHNNITRNTIAENHVGVEFSYGGSYNRIYHNNIIDNTHQALPDPGDYNIWDDGYPSGGNYWSDYTDVDLYSGPYQNITGSDSIGDTPYIIDADNQDRYPLMKTWPPHQIVQTSVHIGCKDYPITIESNTTITKVVATTSTLHFKTSGPDGTIGYINVTFPVELNKTAIKVFVDSVKLTPPPFPVINTNGTHYFIYFEFTLSTHDITIQYAIADLAVTSVATSKTVVGQGYTLTINVTIENQGNYTETFNVIVYANTTIIATLTSISLANGTSTILTFTWNTTDFAKGNYTMSAYAWPVPGEIETANNDCTDGWVFVAMVGDVNADGIVNIIDLATIGQAYGAYVGEPRYNPNADINDDGAIDIFDLATCAINYGTTDP